MGTAKEVIRCLHAMTNDAAAAMGTGGCQGVDGALEAVEYMRLAAHLHLKTFVIDVAAHLTRGGFVPQHAFTFIHMLASFLV
jgi:hypothetical protein